MKQRRFRKSERFSLIEKYLGLKKDAACCVNFQQDELIGGVLDCRERVLGFGRLTRR